VLALAGAVGLGRSQRMPAMAPLIMNCWFRAHIEAHESLVIVQTVQSRLIELPLMKANGSACHRAGPACTRPITPAMSRSTAALGGLTETGGPAGVKVRKSARATVTMIRADIAEKELDYDAGAALRRQAIQA